jgi:hypothetical protein
VDVAYVALLARFATDARPLRHSRNPTTQITDATPGMTEFFTDATPGMPGFLEVARAQNPSIVNALKAKTPRKARGY